MKNRSYMLKAVGMVIVFWLISPFVAPPFYPPRETTLVEYFCTVAIGITSVVIWPPHFPKRFMYYGDFYAVIPILFHQISMYASNFETQLRLGRNPSADLIIFPVIRIALLVATATFVWEFLYSRTYVESKPDKTNGDPGDTLNTHSPSAQGAGGR